MKNILTALLHLTILAIALFLVNNYLLGIHDPYASVFGAIFGFSTATLIGYLKNEN